MISLSRLVVIITVMWSTGCAEPAPPPSTIEQIADEYLAGLMESDALMGTYYSIEGARHDRLPDNSLSGIAAWHRKKTCGSRALSLSGRLPRSVAATGSPRDA